MTASTSARSPSESSAIATSAAAASPASARAEPSRAARAGQRHCALRLRKFGELPDKLQTEPVALLLVPRRGSLEFGRRLIEDLVMFHFA